MADLAENLDAAGRSLLIDNKGLTLVCAVLEFGTLLDKHQPSGNARYAMQVTGCRLLRALMSNKFGLADVYMAGCIWNVTCRTLRST